MGLLLTTKTTKVWASRDVKKKTIKIWDREPTYVETNECFTGKDYLGCSCLNKWPGPELKEGEKRELQVSFTDI